MSLGPAVYGVALTSMIVMLAAIVLGDRQSERLRSLSERLRKSRRNFRRTPVRIALRYVLTTSLVGLALFVLPPTGEMPVPWQILLAFVAWIAWCYRYGLVARRRVTLATAEAIPSLSLSLGWAHLLVVARTAIL